MVSVHQIAVKQELILVADQLLSKIRFSKDVFFLLCILNKTFSNEVHSIVMENPQLLINNVLGGYQYPTTHHNTFGKNTLQIYFEIK